MLDIQLADLAIAEQLKETTNIYRSAPGMDYDPNNANSFTTIAANIEIVLDKPLSPQTTLPTGEVIENPDFFGYLFVPNTNIRSGDILISTTRPKLRVTDVYHPNNTNIMTLSLREN